MKCLSVVVTMVIFVVVAVGPGHARDRDNPNYGFCKSGKKVTDTKQCKENGGSS
jgi:hypothetical protein